MKKKKKIEMTNFFTNLGIGIMSNVFVNTYINKIKYCQNYICTGLIILEFCNIVKTRMIQILNNHSKNKLDSWSTFNFFCSKLCCIYTRIINNYLLNHINYSSVTAFRNNIVNYILKRNEVERTPEAMPNYRILKTIEIYYY